jgi:hypothetical protein
MMSESEFERRLAASGVDALLGGTSEPEPIAGGYASAPEPEPAPSGYAGTRSGATGSASASGSTGSTGTTRTRGARVKVVAKPRRVQRMFAIEEDLDRKLWLYAIHMGKDRSDVVNDLLRPVVASMVLYDSRDRRASASRASEAPDATADLAEAG